MLFDLLIFDLGLLSVATFPFCRGPCDPDLVCVSYSYLYLDISPLHTLESDIKLLYLTLDFSLTQAVTV